ncbi:hypothetical protein FOA52_005443 [Chlamydomonas sp. UWO 241]|nr:hypothetical protein FOA52_005443 [Chlamydomonas sp. UWO 241]
MAGGGATARDDLGLTTSPAGRVQEMRRPPPRRAVTWVNEISFNLTVAVGSWAYMAPEVGLVRGTTG